VFTREFQIHRGWVAQLVEQRTENPRVGGSIPPPATTIKKRDCKLFFARRAEDFVQLLSGGRTSKMHLTPFALSFYHRCFSMAHGAKSSSTTKTL
jgi:hypothetical protein